MKITMTGLGVTLVIVAFLALVFAAIGGWTGLALQDEDPFPKILTVLASLFIVAALLERALAVFNKIIFGNDLVTARNRYENALTVAKASALVNGVTDRPLVSDVQVARLNLDQTNDKRKWLRLCVGFLVSVLLSVAGFQVLSSLVTVPAAPNLFEGFPKAADLQSNLFVAMDIFLTAGLLAGGAQGIADLIELFRNQQTQRQADREAERLAVGYTATQASSLRAAGVIPPHEAPALGSVRSTPGSRGQMERFESGVDTSWLRGGSRTQFASDERERFAGHRGDMGSDSDTHDDSAAFLETATIGMMRERTATQACSTAWRVAKSLKKLRAQIDARFPDRNEASDGTIGDTRHCPGPSDHCPNDDNVVTAYDCTHDPSSGCDMDVIIENIRKSEDPRIKYVIYDHRIFSSYDHRNGPPWSWRPYSGSNPHTKHAHISVLSDPSKYDDESEWSI